jgi:hypothetical protein
VYEYVVEGDTASEVVVLGARTCFMKVPFR